MTVIRSDIGTWWMDEWEESDEFEDMLGACGIPPSSYLTWQFERRHALAVARRRLSDHDYPASITYADHNMFLGQDFAGTWSFKPADGLLQPIDLHELAVALLNPADLDMIGRAILESRLVFDGYNPFHARWGVEKWVDGRGLAWCNAPNAKPLTPTLVEYGWSNVARDVAGEIKGHEGLLPKRWLSPLAIARFAESMGCADGPAHTTVFYDAGESQQRDFWWNRLAYPLDPQCFALVSVLWSAEDHSLPISDVLSAAWKKCRRDQKPSDAGMVRVCATRVNTALDGTGVKIFVKKHKLHSWLQVSLTTP